MIRTDIIRLYKSVHTWTGIVAGMALFIAFYAGALTLFKDQVGQWAVPPATAAGGTVPDRLPGLIQGVLRERPQAGESFEIALASTGGGMARMRWNEPAPDGQGPPRSFAATLGVDGIVRIAPDPEGGLAQLIYTLHAVVGLPVVNGFTLSVMGVVAVLYTLALVSGVIVLLPTLTRDFFALRLGGNLKRMWLDAHNVTGIVSLPFHLVMALTSVAFAFHDRIYDAQDWLIHGTPAAAVAPEPASGPAPAAARDPAALQPPQELLALAQALSATFVPQALDYHDVAGADASVTVYGTDPAALARQVAVTLDPYSGRVVQDDLTVPRGAAQTLVDSFFALHLGSFGGMLVRWMYFVLALAGAWLFYSGNLLWLETRRRRQRPGGERPVQRRDAQWLAAATVGVCLGCVAGLSLTIAAGKWLHGRVDDPGAWHAAIYYLVFAGALCWAFWRGAARAAVHLLWLAAAATAAIAASTLVLWLAPVPGPWAQAGPPAMPGVDGTALAGALCLAAMARATARRVWHLAPGTGAPGQGAPDSLWSAGGR